MTTVFIAGSMSIKHIDRRVLDRIDNIIKSDFDVVVGDADGADASVQAHLQRHAVRRVTVYCSGGEPRNNLGDWPVRIVETTHAKGTRAFFTAKDVLMAEAGDFGLMIWDAKSTGTLSNVLEMLARERKTVVFVNARKEFKTVATVAELEDLVRCMSDHARSKAEEKLGLRKRIEALRNRQGRMFA